MNLSQLTPGKDYRPVAPDGTAIVGTLEVIEATAYVTDVTAEKGGTVDINYAGESKVDWDTQKTVKKRGSRVWVDADGALWPEHKLNFVEV